jgi:hypothetical protein
MKKVIFVRALLSITGGTLAKLSILLLLNQTFTFEGHMKLALRGGLGATFVAFVLSMGFQIAYGSPRPGETWDDMFTMAARGQGRRGTTCLPKLNEAPFGLSWVHA